MELFSHRVAARIEGLLAEQYNQGGGWKSLPTRRIVESATSPNDYRNYCFLSPACLIAAGWMGADHEVFSWRLKLWKMIHQGEARAEVRRELGKYTDLPSLSTAIVHIMLRDAQLTDIEHPMLAYQMTKDFIWSLAHYPGPRRGFPFAFERQDVGIEAAGV